jgi:hypothetical protein
MIGLQPIAHGLRAARLLIGLTVLAVAVPALGEQPPPCTSDASRVIFAGASNGPCKKFHGDQASCEQAYYLNRDGEAVSCGYVEGTCVGCGGGNFVCGTNTCDGTPNPLSPIGCTGDPDRSAFLGQGDNGSARCRNLDQTDQATCENAYYEDDDSEGGEPVACSWDSGNGFCEGCGENDGGRSQCPVNSCDPIGADADATCTEDSGRSNLLGFGGNNSRRCRVLDDTDQSTCEDAYYEDQNSGLPVACWWNGRGGCRGSGFDDYFGWNRCLSSVAPPTATATCPMDSRTNLLGFGGNEFAPCRQLDGTNEATCEDAFYEDVHSGVAAACFWDGDECRGSFHHHLAENACVRTVVSETATAVCTGRSNLLGFGGNITRSCRILDDTDQSTCEDAYYESSFSGAAVACVWDGSDCRGCSGFNGDTCSANACATPTCPGDPTRTNFIGFGSTRNGLGNDGGSCRQFDEDEGGDEDACEDAYYMAAGSDRVVGCWWDGGDCRGATRNNFEEDACLLPPSAVCTGRNTLLGYGSVGAAPCRTLDGDEGGNQAMCEDAFYENAFGGNPVACYWGAGEICSGSGPRHAEQNACLREPEVADATCAGDVNRTMRVGFGNDNTGEHDSACRSLDDTDQATCEMAFYENIFRGTGVACWWDSGDCRGSSDEFQAFDACLSRPVTCTLDPTRDNPLGIGGTDTSPCRDFDFTDEDMCESSYYVSRHGPVPVACWWDGDECRGTSDRYAAFNECIFDSAPAVADVVCDSTPERTMLLGFGGFRDGNRGTHACRILDASGGGDQAMCENAYYQNQENGFAVACWWNGADCRGSSRNYSENNVCLPEAVCTLDPGRTNILGFGGNDTGVCRQIEAMGEAVCNNSYYVHSSRGEPVACWWNADEECRGSSDANGRLNACLRTPLPASATCGARTNLLGFGNNDSAPCRQLDDMEMECENAYYEDPEDYQPVACIWAPGVDDCYGTHDWPELNACDPATATPPACGDPTRTLFVGKGGQDDDTGRSGGACRQFDDDEGGDEATCESAYYVNDDGQPIACWWDDDDCLGTGQDGEERRRYNTCVPQGVTCGDRSTTAGFNESSACEIFDDLDSCNDAYYFDSAGRPIACYWDDDRDDCVGCGRNSDGRSTCPINACDPIECAGDLGRTRSGRCADLNSQEACEDAWHVIGNEDLPPFAASCSWNDSQRRCIGCGLPSQSNRECTNECATDCGNGVIDGGEVCDDGNMFDGDCCDSSCQLEPNGSPCTDRLFCTEGVGTCQSGACTGAPSRLCASCLIDDCDEFDNRCLDGNSSASERAVGAAEVQGLRPDDMSMPVPEGTICDDGLEGTAASMCDATGMCVEGAPVEPTPAPPMPTPTPTRVPLGGDCEVTAQCVSGAVCIASVCVEIASPAPAASNTALFAMLAALIGIAAFGLRRRRN